MQWQVRINGDRWQRGPGFWSAVRDFMGDNNGTVGVHIKLADWAPPTVGTCGRHPDDVAMDNEAVSKFDLYADEQGWDGPMRLYHGWLQEKFRKVARLSWMQNQAYESRRTKELPLDKMSPKEQDKFIRELRTLARNYNRKYLR